MKVIDHHSHLEFDRENTIKDITHYLIGQITISKNDDIRKIMELNEEEYSTYFINNLELINNTDYYKNFMKCMKDNFNITKITMESLKKITSSSTNNDIINNFEYILTIANSEQTKFNNVMSIHYCDTYIYRDFIKSKKFTFLSEYLNFIKTKLDNESKMVGLKLGIAYHRTLEIEVFNYEEFQYMTIEHFCNLENTEDIIINYLISYAENKNIPIQIHCGLLEISAQENMDISLANPLLLQKVIQNYRKVNFVLLHCGFPFCNEQIAVAMSNYNVYIDFSWLTYMNNEIYANALKMALASIPLNKIIGFGSDVSNIYIADTLRQIIIKKLKELDLRDADIENILYYNIIELYNLRGKYED